MTDWRLAEALKVQQMFGSDAARYVAERIGALALAGDMRGVERFSEIADRLEQLLVAERRPG